MIKPQGIRSRERGSSQPVAFFSRQKLPIIPNFFGARRRKNFANKFFKSPKMTFLVFGFFPFYLKKFWLKNPKSAGLNFFDCFQVAAPSCQLAGPPPPLDPPTPLGWGSAFFFRPAGGPPPPGPKRKPLLKFVSIENAQNTDEPVAFHRPPPGDRRPYAPALPGGPPPPVMDRRPSRARSTASNAGAIWDHAICLVCSVSASGGGGADLWPESD